MIHGNEYYYQLFLLYTYTFYKIYKFVLPS